MFWVGKIDEDTVDCPRFVAFKGASREDSPSSFNLGQLTKRIHGESDQFDEEEARQVQRKDRRRRAPFYLESPIGFTFTWNRPLCAVLMLLGGGGGGGVEPPSWVWGGAPKNFWRVAFLMQETNNFTSFTSQAASRWLTCSCWLTWHKTRTYLLKDREKEKQARKLRDRQEKESAKDPNIERCSGKQVHGVAQDYDRLQYVVNIAVPDFGSARRCAIACALQQSHAADWTGVFRGIIHDFADWDGFFFSFSFFCFLFFSFSISLFFFGTRLLTLHKLRYVATRLSTVSAYNVLKTLGKSGASNGLTWISWHKPMWLTPWKSLAIKCLSLLLCSIFAGSSSASTFIPSHSTATMSIKCTSYTDNYCQVAPIRTKS